MYLLGEHQAQSDVYLGHVFHRNMPHGYTSGGAGYLISKPAVRKIVHEGPKFPGACPKDGRFEDIQLGRYMPIILHD